MKEIEPDKDPNTWLIEAKLDEDVVGWELYDLTFDLPRSKAKSLKAVVEPARVPTIGPDFRVAQKITLGHNSNQPARVIDPLADH